MIYLLPETEEVKALLDLVNVVRDTKNMGLISEESHDEVQAKIKTEIHAKLDIEEPPEEP